MINNHLNGLPEDNGESRVRMYAKEALKKIDTPEIGKALRDGTK